MDDRSGLDGRNLVLTGFMGTGKTTVGRLLADRLGYEFVDTDAVIEARHGPISLIFADHGEARFRRLERDLAEELAARQGLVVSTGGRMMIDAANARALGATGEVFCLTATVDTLVARLAPELSVRPLLAGSDPRERIAALLAERADGYGRFTPIATDARSPADIADEIIALVGGENASHG